jgi:hypothetical protein
MLQVADWNQGIALNGSSSVVPLTLDNQWRYSCINLFSQLSRSLPAVNASQLFVEGVLFHPPAFPTSDWIGGDFYIDEFSITNVPRVGTFWGGGFMNLLIFGKD